MCWYQKHKTTQYNNPVQGHCRLLVDFIVGMQKALETHVTQLAFQVSKPHRKPMRKKTEKERDKRP